MQDNRYKEMSKDREGNRNRNDRNGRNDRNNTNDRNDRNNSNNSNDRNNVNDRNFSKRNSPVSQERSVQSVQSVQSGQRVQSVKSESPALDIRVNDEGDDRIEGRNPVIEAIRAGRSINKILISKGEREGSITQIIALAKDKGLVVQEVDRLKLDSLSVTHAHQGVIALAAAKDYVEVEDIIEAAVSKGEQPFIIILDEINDAYNLGSILRSANAAGAHGVIIPKRRAVGLTALVAKASAGAMEYVPVARVTNISQTIEYLKKNNIWVVGTDSTGEKAFYDNDLKGAIALVIGNEGEGMGRLVRESCDFVVNLPMKGQVSSLNAAVAGAIVMYEIQRQRGK